MSDYGLFFGSDYGGMVIGSSVKSMKFTGKASRVSGSKYYPSDQPGVWKTYWYDCTFSTGSWSPTGTRQLRCMGIGGCGSVYFPFSVGDVVSYGKYFIASSTSPLVFIHSSSSGVAANVLSQVAVTGGYELTTVTTYPTGTRSTADSYITLYCFETVNLSPQTGFGFETYSASGDVTFTDAVKTLNVRNIIRLNSVSGSWGNIGVNIATMSNPPTELHGLNKPAVLAKDWGRLIRHDYSPYSIYTHKHWYTNNCEDSRGYTAKMSKRYMPGGVTVADGIIDVVVVGSDILSWSCCHPAGSSDSVEWTTNLPASLPVIEGASYD